MEVQLKEIIAKLKGEGIEEAQKQARQIIDEAKVKSQSILNEAEQQAKKLRQHAEEDAKRFLQSGTESVRHAARDLLLLVKKEVEALLTRLLSEQVGEVLSGPQLAECIVGLFSQWNPEKNVEIQIPPGQAETLVATLTKQLQKNAQKGGIEIKPFAELSAGFRVVLQKGAVVYDFSQDEVAHLLGHLLHPRFAELLS